MVTGLGWIGVIATINGTVQAFLPTWVPTRGLSLYQLVLFGGTALGSALCGALATIFGAAEVLTAGGILVALLGVATFARPLATTAGIGRETVPFDADPSQAQQHDETAVLVTVRYDVAAEDADKFLRLMGEVEQSRYRTGARQWRLLQRSGAPGEYIEVFRVGSWREHRDQLQSRNTRFDADLLQRARALSTHPPIIEHLTPIAVRPPRGRRAER